MACASGVDGASRSIRSHLVNFCDVPPRNSAVPSPPTSLWVPAPVARTEAPPPPGRHLQGPGPERVPALVLAVGPPVVAPLLPRLAGWWGSGRRWRDERRSQARPGGRRRVRWHVHRPPPRAAPARRHGRDPARQPGELHALHAAAA